MAIRLTNLDAPGTPVKLKQGFEIAISAERLLGSGNGEVALRCPDTRYSISPSAVPISIPDGQNAVVTTVQVMLEGPNPSSTIVVGIDGQAEDWHATSVTVTA